MITHQVNTKRKSSLLFSYLRIESAIKQRDLFKRYCNGEDIFNEEPMVTSASFVFRSFGCFLNVCFFFRRTTMKRSVENLPDDEGKNITREKSFSGCLILDQPSAKRPMHTTSTSYSDN